MRQSQLFDEDHHQSSLFPSRSPLRSTADAQRMRVGLPTPTHDNALLTLHAAKLSFDRVGFWGAELSVERDGDGGLRVRFFVSDESEVPMMGDLVPRTEQKVLRDVSDIARSRPRPTPTL